MKVLELFSGYGTASFALKQLGIEFELVGYSDIDKYANQVFKQNHNGKELGDVRNIRTTDLPNFDLLTGGFPCQSFSVAGKGLGEADPRGTLFNEIIRIAEAKKPRYMLLENVKGLTTKKHKATFEKILSELKRIGYYVKWQILNTKEHGIPQNRERVFFVCFREQEDYDKFSFPEKEELNIFIKDILEPEPVEPKYYLKPHQIQKLLEGIEKKQRSKVNVLQNVNSTTSVLCARDFKTPKVVQIDSSGKGFHSQNDRIYNADGVMCSLPSSVGGDKLKIFALRGRNPENYSDRSLGCPTEQTPEFREDGCSNTLTSVEKDNLLCINLQPREGKGIGGKGIIYKDDGTAYCGDSANGQALAIQRCGDSDKQTYSTSEIGYSVCANPQSDMVARVYTEGIFRRLTPKEVFRLQGFLKDEVNLDGVSDTQKFRLAGNGQSVNVVKKIFQNMFALHKNNYLKEKENGNGK